MPASSIDMHGMCRKHGIGCNFSEPHCQPVCVDPEDCEPLEEDENDAPLVDEDAPLDDFEVSEIVESEPHHGPRIHKMRRPRPQKDLDDKQGKGKLGGYATQRKRNNGNGRNIGPRNRPNKSEHPDADL